MHDERYTSDDLQLLEQDWNMALGRELAVQRCPFCNKLLDGNSPRQDILYSGGE
jgi:hypothetical protein